MIALFFIPSSVAGVNELWRFMSPATFNFLGVLPSLQL